MLLKVLQIGITAKHANLVWPLQIRSHLMWCHQLLIQPAKFHCCFECEPVKNPFEPASIKTELPIKTGISKLKPTSSFKKSGSTPLEHRAYLLGALNLGRAFEPKPRLVPPPFKCERLCLMLFFVMALPNLTIWWLQQLEDFKHVLSFKNSHLLFFHPTWWKNNSPPGWVLN